MSVRDALAHRRVVVVCGPGGVGKTTTSAAIALDAARDRKVIVVTIDPAKRLAVALGLDTGLAHAQSTVELPDGFNGTLDAAMLDMKTAWDDLVDRYSPTRAQAERIKTNRIYRGISEQFVGSQGYMAMERLADLYDRGGYDLIVIDTPPTRSALDFLEAPKRMTDFIGGSLLKWLAKPYAAAGRLGARAFSFTASPFLRIADRVLGSQVLEDMSALVMDFQNMYDGFKERAEQVLDLLSSEETGFMVVTSLEGAPLQEAEFFIDRLVDESLQLAGIVANKVVPLELGQDTTAPDEPDGVDGKAFEEAKEAFRTLSVLARRDARCLEELRHRARAPVAHVPLMTHDIHDVDGLRELAAYVLGDSGVFGGAVGSSTRG